MFRKYFDSVWHYSLQGKMAVCSFVMGCVIACICLFNVEPFGEIATSAITITLHADAYARAMANADIVAALQAHPNVSLASA